VRRVRRTREGPSEASKSDGPALRVGSSKRAGKRNDQKIDTWSVRMGSKLNEGRAFDFRPGRRGEGRYDGREQERGAVEPRSGEGKTNLGGNRRKKKDGFKWRVSLVGKEKYATCRQTARRGKRGGVGAKSNGVRREKGKTEVGGRKGMISVPERPAGIEDSEKRAGKNRRGCKEEIRAKASWLFRVIPEGQRRTGRGGSFSGSRMIKKGTRKKLWGRGLTFSIPGRRGGEVDEWSRGSDTRFVCSKRVSARRNTQLGQSVKGGFYGNKATINRERTRKTTVKEAG